MPTLGETARTFTGRTAMRHLVTRYLETSVAAPAALFPRLFGWNAGVTERVVGEMLADGRPAQVKGSGRSRDYAAAKARQPEGDIWVWK